MIMPALIVEDCRVGCGFLWICRDSDLRSELTSPERKRER